MNNDLYTVRRAERVGDTVMFALRWLLYTPALALILAVIVLLLGEVYAARKEVFEFMTQTYPWLLLPAAPAAWLVSCRDLYWKMTLDGRGLRASGLCRRRALAYDDLRLLRLDDALQPPGEETPKGDLLLRIQPHAGRELRIYLPSAAAQALFDTLRERSPHAAALGADGTAYPARVDDDGEAARRLRRVVLWRGGALAASGAVFLLLAVFAGGAPGDSVSATHDAMLRYLLIGQGAVFLGFGLRLLGQRSVTGQPPGKAHSPARENRNPVTIRTKRR